MDNQISFFEMLGMDETPEIPFEQQKKGMKGWVIRVAAHYTVENGFDRNMVGVEVRHMILEKDSDTDKHGRWQYAKSCDNCKGDGWWGRPKKLYAKRPTWRECEEYVRKNRPEYDGCDVVYVHKDGDAIHRIQEYKS